MRQVPAWLRDWWVPVALSVVAVIEVMTAYADHPSGRSGLLSVQLPLALATFARRRSPAVAVVAVSVLTGVLVVGVLTSVAEQPPLTPFLVLLVTLFNFGNHGEGPRFLPAGLVAAGCLGGLQLAALAAGQSAGDVVPSVLFLTGSFVLGRALRRSRVRAMAEQERAVTAELSRDQHAADAVAAERARIARELHDVIAHALTGIVVQASVEARLGGDPDDARVATLRSIEERGREAMTELRRLLGLLREEGQGAGSDPLPSLAGADALVEGLRGAGHAVTFERVGDFDDLPPALDLAGYRVLQEALTNVARHAPGADTAIRIEHRPGDLLVAVTNAAPRHEPTRLGRGGSGLPGMRERVRVFGGRLETSAQPDGGFAVHAHLPLPVESPEPA